MKHNLPDGLYFIPVIIQDGNQYVIREPVSIEDFMNDAINEFIDTIGFYFNPKYQAEKNEIKDEYGIRETLG